VRNEVIIKDGESVGNEKLPDIARGLVVRSLSPLSVDLIVQPDAHDEAVRRLSTSAHFYRRRGRQLNSLSQANAYGDDARRWPPTIRSSGSSVLAATMFISAELSTTPPWLWPRERKSFTPTSTYRTWFPPAVTS
jgi:hypothetical protein